MRALELKVPPVVVVFLVAVFMWLTAAGVSQFRSVRPGLHFVAECLTGTGVVTSGLGLVSFRRAKTTVNPTKPGSSSSLVVSGIYRLTRNPMYLGFFLILSGWAVFLTNPFTLLFLPAFISYMNSFQIVPEERALELVFGKEFSVYKSRTRRWI